MFSRYTSTQSNHNAIDNQGLSTSSLIANHVNGPRMGQNLDRRQWSRKTRQLHSQQTIYSNRSVTCSQLTEALQESRARPKSSLERGETGAAHQKDHLVAAAFHVWRRLQRCNVDNGEFSIGALASGWPTSQHCPNVTHSSRNCITAPLIEPSRTCVECAPCVVAITQLSTISHSTSYRARKTGSRGVATPRSESQFSMPSSSPSERVECKTIDGTVIRGSFYAAVSSPAPAIIMTPGVSVSVLFLAFLETSL
nr:hypothetical protein CFP56_07547 [Quercus suber]